MRSFNESKKSLALANLRITRSRWAGSMGSMNRAQLKQLSYQFRLSVALGDVLLLDAGWYVTHAGLIRLANRRHCSGIAVEAIPKLSDPTNHRFAFKATVYKAHKSLGFVGYGDADPFNVSPLVRGAEMRIAETRAVNRALRKAYGIGICSLEEIGSGRLQPTNGSIRKVSQESSNGSSGQRENGNGSRVRDRLCQLIRQHQLDAELVKSYAVDFCGTKTLREASREQVENFVAHLADWAEKDRNALLCQLNSYARPKAGAA